jgi:cob(I)alamin adenosyltransferase
MTDAETTDAEISDAEISDAEAERHREKMEKRKAVQDAEVAGKTIEKGLLIVNTGPGKGKTTAALGLMLRALGHGWRVGVVQFIKGAWDTGEKHALKAFGTQIDWHTLGEGFTWETQDKARDIAAFRSRRPDLHVIVTGRNAKPALIEAADLVTEMGSVKHHFAAGVKAQAGIEF